MTFIINSILTGTWGITVVLLVIQLFRLKLQINPIIIRSVSTLLLFGASLYILKIPVEFITNYYSGGEYEQYTFADGNLLYSLIIYCAWLFSFGLLPQILWVKKLRGRLSSLVVIVAIWAITRLYVPWGISEFFMEKPIDLNFKFEFSFLDRLEQVAIYSVAFVLVFYIISRKENNSRPMLGEQPNVD